MPRSYMATHLDYSSSDPKIGRSSWIMSGPRINHMSPWKRASSQMRKRKSKREQSKGIKRTIRAPETEHPAGLEMEGTTGKAWEGKWFCQEPLRLGEGPGPQVRSFTPANTLISASWDPDQGNQLSPRHSWPSELRWYPSVLLGC